MYEYESMSMRVWEYEYEYDIVDSVFGFEYFICKYDKIYEIYYSII